MATMLHSESRRLYSWWWDSHNSPKNSKWLQENLKVIKVPVIIGPNASPVLIIINAFQPPELMKLVEEFYRAYRALAERYDHTMGQLCQVDRTMAECEPHRPEMPHRYEHCLEKISKLESELSCAREEIRCLNSVVLIETTKNKRYQALMEQVESVGLNPKCIASSVRDLQDENTKLRQICKEDRDNKEALFKKLENMEQLLDKNVVLESSLSDLSSELKGSQANVKAL
ncbi:hypothetical protein HYC85_024129 [Camellia sinensis]|uniref:NAB domain-containing protein n=1 Tax=Camellia sinensis TaxID=4442 RepID=A0A7J7G777_CAMSI|nr:hypothetical protein HYC85_024129 [Camellia sinensis]